MTGKESPVIVIAAGGTGGHIFPAIATGQALQQMRPDATIIYACGERPLEVGLYQKNKIKPVVFPARQISAGLSGKISGIMAAAGNVWRARQWVKSVNADLVVGFGGYVAGPTVLGAWLAGCKTAIHEANSIPGRTNRILGPLVHLTAAHFESTLKRLGGRNKMAVGMPIRPLAAATSPAQARISLNLEPDKPTLLIMGGSQGALFLYESLIKVLPELDSKLSEPVQILWSTGEAHLVHLQALASKVTLNRINLQMVPFIADMGNALMAADLALARAGASALAELTAFGVYTVYVPFPGAIYDHQTLNAREVSNYQLGVMLPEKDVPARVVDVVLEAFNTVRTTKLPTPPPSLESGGAARRLAQALLDLI